jgi:two-component system, sensor histidine kinase
MWIVWLLGLIAVVATGVSLWLSRQLSLLRRERQESAEKAWRFIEEEQRVVELMGRGASFQEVLDTLTHSIEKMAHDCFCTILLLDEERRHLMKGSGGSLPGAYMEAVNGLAIGPDVGACGSAAFRNQTIVIEDIATDHRFEGGARDFIMSFGLRACWSVPIRDSNHQVLGTFAMYHRHPAKPTGNQLMLVEVGAHLAGNALERLRATTRLKEYAQRIDLSERAAHFGLWEVVGDRIKFSNGFAALIGQSDGTRELSLERWNAMIPEDDRARMAAAGQACLEQGCDMNIESRVMMPDGSAQWHRVHARQELKEGKVVRIVGASIDVTREKEVSLRLEQAMRAKSAFLANMSHEIRTPINGLLGSVALLLDAGVSTDQREWVDTIRSCGESLLQLLNDILDLSKIEAGKLHLEHIPFPVDQLVKGAMAVVSPMAAGRGLSLFVEVDERLPRVLVGDPQRLHQTLLNLLSNAVKFTGQGSIRLLVERRSGSESNVEVQFTVQDTGIGIPREAQEAIFEPFTQADSSTTRRYGGTGLGLTICRQLASLMQGRLELESAPGSGSTFRVIVPLEVAGDTEAVPSGVPDRIPRSSCSLHILIAEDNPINQKVAARLLEKMGHRVDIVGDGRKAIAAVEQVAYDAVLMDCQMPDIDGYTAARAISRLTMGRLPIIAMTAHASPEDRELCLEAGMADHITKPISAQRLFDLLEALQPASEPSCC